MNSRKQSGDEGMKKQSKKSTRGHTMLEAAMATTLLLVVVGGTYTAVSQAGESWNSVVQRTYVQAKSREMIQRVTEELKQAVNITIDENTDAHGDILSFQLPLSITDGTVSWGATLRGVVNGKPAIIGLESHVVQYLVIQKTTQNGMGPRMLVRRVINSDLEIVGKDEIIAMHLDMERNGKKGFKVDKTGDLYTVKVRMLKIRGRTEAPEAGDDINGQGNGHMIHLKSTILSRNTIHTDNE